MTQPTLTIDLDAIAANWRALDALSGGAETAAAVKANGYGCGAAEVAGALAGAGCRTFFVATLEEGIALRASQPEAAIYILNGVARDEATEAKGRSLRPCLNHLGQIEAWREVAGGACAIQLDSGMSRLGLPPEEIDGVPGNLHVDLIMSHLACADTPEHPANAEQKRRFTEMVARLSAVAPQARLSLAATGGTLLGADYHYDLVRCGIGLYGGLPFAGAKPVVSLSVPILQIRDIPEGQSVGYGWAHTAAQGERIATLPLGYADGMHRALAGGAQVFIGGKPAPVVGRVSMDLISVAVTEFPDASPGDPVEIIGENQSIDDLAAAASTIGYEVLTSLGSRYTRRYKGGEVTGS